MAASLGCSPLTNLHVKTLKRPPVPACHDSRFVPGGGWRPRPQFLSAALLAGNTKAGWQQLHSAHSRPTPETRAAPALRPPLQRPARSAGPGEGVGRGCGQQRRQRERREGTGRRGDGSGNPRPERLKPLRAEGPRRPDPRPPREGSTRGPRRLGAGGLARPGPAKGMGMEAVMEGISNGKREGKGAGREGC